MPRKRVELETPAGEVVEIPTVVLIEVERPRLDPIYHRGLRFRDGLHEPEQCHLEEIEAMIRQLDELPDELEPARLCPKCWSDDVAGTNVTATFAAPDRRP